MWRIITLTFICKKKPSVPCQRSLEIFRTKCYCDKKTHGCNSRKPRRLILFRQLARLISLHFNTKHLRYTSNYPRSFPMKYEFEKSCGNDSDSRVLAKKKIVEKSEIQRDKKMRKFCSWKINELYSKHSYRNVPSNDRFYRTLK